jgi:hypothetical protein
LSGQPAVEGLNIFHGKAEIPGRVFRWVALDYLPIQCGRVKGFADSTGDRIDNRRGVYKQGGIKVGTNRVWKKGGAKFIAAVPGIELLDTHFWA